MSGRRSATRPGSARGPRPAGHAAVRALPGGSPARFRRGTVTSTSAGARIQRPCQQAAAAPDTAACSPAHSHAARTRASSVRRCPPTRYTAGYSLSHKPVRTRRRTVAADMPLLTACCSASTPACRATSCSSVTPARDRRPRLAARPIRCTRLCDRRMGSVGCRRSCHRPFVDHRRRCRRSSLPGAGRRGRTTCGQLLSRAPFLRGPVGARP